MDKFFSPKQIESIRDSNNKLNIWEGAVRSGKTYASLWRFIDECRNGPAGQFAMITRTFDSFRRNCLPELENIMGRQVSYSSGKREMHIGTRLIHVIGADDERAEAKIRGPTFAGIYIDEGTIIPESVFRMALSRISIDGAKIFCTTNPDTPYHWLKRDFLNGQNEDVSSWQFFMDDNPALSEEYKEYLKRQYSGVWYRRYINGEWVQAEGAIYDFFDPKIHCLDLKPPQIAEYYLLGIDYGTTNPCAFVLIGFNGNHYPNMWVEREYYWDSKVRQRQKTDSEYADDLLKFTENLEAPLKAIYLDPSAVSFRTELQRHKVRGVLEANNEVIDGIRFVSNLMANGSIKIVRCCKNLQHELQSYVWDEKARERGVDKPLKQNDHMLDALRYVLFSHYGKHLGTENRMTPEDLASMRRKWGIT
jgi:PBSX family phage terminase large subunit